jgi:hypothetical protein
MNGINTTQLRNVNGYLTIVENWLSTFGNTIWCKLTGCTMTGDLNMNGNNITNVKNISSDYYCNSTNCYTLVNFLTTSSSTDTWSLNYSFYYNKTLIDNNFTLYTPLTSLYANLTNYMLKNGTTIGTGNFNFGNYNISGINNLTSNYICNSSNCYTLVNFLTDTGGTDSWALNYTFYYNKTLIDNNLSLYMSIASWNTNLTQINTNLYGNLSNYLLLNGSKTMTGNLNFSNSNITNPSNIVMKEISGACDLTINHSFCSNITGSYWVG